MKKYTKTLRKVVKAVCKMKNGHCGGVGHCY